jgi:hypothetical protein
MTQLAAPLHSATNGGQPVAFGALAEYGAGTTGVPKIWRAAGIVGDYAVASVMLYAADGVTPLLGQQAMADSLPVAIASDQGAVPVSMTPAVTAAGLGKAEDAAHVSGDTGVYMLGTRQDSPVATAGTSGDYQGPAFDATGRQYVEAALEGAVVMRNGVACTVKRAAIQAASSGNNTILAAVSGKTLEVLGYLLNAAGTVNAKFQSGAGGTDISGLHYLIANVGALVTPSPIGVLECLNTNTLLNLNLSAAVAVGGWVVYIEK